VCTCEGGQGHPVRVRAWARACAQGTTSAFAACQASFSSCALRPVRGHFGPLHACKRARSARALITAQNLAGVWEWPGAGAACTSRTRAGCEHSHPSEGTIARNGLRTRPPGVDPMAAYDDGRRIPFVSIPRHTLILLTRASAQYSLPRPCNGNFAHASRSDGPRNLLELQALHPAQPSPLVLYCSDFTLTLFHTGRSLDRRNPSSLSNPSGANPSNPSGAQRAAFARSGFLIVCCSDCTPASFPYASAFLLHTHTH